LGFNSVDFDADYDTGEEDLCHIKKRKKRHSLGDTGFHSTSQQRSPQITVETSASVSAAPTPPPQTNTLPTPPAPPTNTNPRGTSYRSPEIDAPFDIGNYDPNLYQQTHNLPKRPRILDRSDYESDKGDTDDEEDDDEEEFGKLAKRKRKKSKNKRK